MIPLLALQVAVVAFAAIWAVDSVRTFSSPVPVPWALVVLVRVVAVLILLWLVGLPPFRSAG